MPILIDTAMLDKRSQPVVAPVTGNADFRLRSPAKPSFGLGSLRNSKGLLAFSTLAFLTIGLVYDAFRPTTYTASSQLLIYIRQIQTGPDLAILPGRADLPLVQSNIQLLRSGNVLVKTVQALELDKDAEFAGEYASSTSRRSSAFSLAFGTLSRNLSVKQLGTSHMISVAYKASDPAKAARVVNAVIRIYLKELARASDAGSSKAPALRELYQSLGPSAFLVSDAQPPIRPDGPPGVLIALSAALVGLFVGAAAALLRDAVNATIRNARQVEYALGIECLGVVPCRAAKGAKAEGATAQDESAQGFSPSEDQELRRLSATVLEASLRDVRTIGVTSAVPGEGATTVAIGLAQAIAACGRRVLLIDGDPESRSVSRWANNLPRIPDWSGQGRHSGALDGLVEARTGLHVLPLWQPADDESGSTGAVLPDAILDSAASSYDLVIVDMPALAAGPDVRAAAHSVDGFLLVVKWGETDSELIRQALRSAGKARPKFVGAVLNMADDDTMRVHGYKRAAEMKVATAS